jgi:hypothetical protein
MLQASVSIVLNVSEVCCECFYIDVVIVDQDVAIVDQDVAHVAMVFSSVCPKYFICFRRMLQVFHLDVAKVDLDVLINLDATSWVTN